jgi:hypothetical protein
MATTAQISEAIIVFIPSLHSSISDFITMGRSSPGFSLFADSDYSIQFWTLRLRRGLADRAAFAVGAEQD